MGGAGWVSSRCRAMSGDGWRHARHGAMVWGALPVSGSTRPDDGRLPCEAVTANNELPWPILRSAVIFVNLPTTRTTAWSANSAGSSSPRFCQQVAARFMFGPSPPTSHAAQSIGAPLTTQALRNTLPSFRVHNHLLHSPPRRVARPTGASRAAASVRQGGFEAGPRFSAARTWRRRARRPWRAIRTTGDPVERARSAAGCNCRFPGPWVVLAVDWCRPRRGLQCHIEQGSSEVPGFAPVPGAGAQPWMVFGFTPPV